MGKKKSKIKERQTTSKKGPNKKEWTRNSEKTLVRISELGI